LCFEELGDFLMKDLRFLLWSGILEEVGYLCKFLAWNRNRIRIDGNAESTLEWCLKKMTEPAMYTLFFTKILMI
jgi:hypothetical protein